MNQDISAYQAEYFVPVVKKVLDRPLNEHGFSYVGDHRGVTVYWASGPLFFRVGYLPETLPNYELLVGVGRDVEPIVPKTSRNSVGVWRLLPHDEAQRIADWRFDTPEKLMAELWSIWTKAVIPHVTPLWADEDALVSLINESDESDQQVMDDRLLHYARGKFDAGSFAEASNAYDELPADRLTRADVLRARMARRRL